MLLDTAIKPNPCIWKQETQQYFQFGFFLIENVSFSLGRIKYFQNLQFNLQLDKARGQGYLKRTVDGIESSSKICIPNLKTY